MTADDRPATRKTTTKRTASTARGEGHGGARGDLDVAPRATTPEPEHARITTKQMRELHALLRDHGITGDRAVHDYLAAAGLTVESRSDLTTIDAARLIAELETAPVTRAAGPARLAELREPFPAEAIGKLPRSTCKDCSDSPRKRCEQHGWVSACSECRGSHSSATMHIDYVGHADVTDRLLTVDPEWTWEPAMGDTNGLPSIAASCDPQGNLWIKLTVLGVTRYAVGDGKNPKERIGDALRNGAMRFGVALDLWAKGDRDWAHAEKSGTDQHPDEAQPRQQEAPAPTPPPYAGPSTPELLAMIDSHAVRAGTTYAAITEKWRAAHGGLTVEAMETQPPQLVAQLEASIAAYLAENPPAPMAATG